MTAVRLEQVTKSFGEHVAVDDLSLEVPTGTIYGFIGPNGSGKTTTLRMIMHILHPDRGQITVLGEKTATAANDRVGYLPEERGLYKQMKVRELLRFYAELKGLRRPGPAVDAWLKRLDLTAWGDKKVQALSKGMSQKVQFIATVVAEPKLVILDEPFSGLDPINAEVLREAVLDLKRAGTTIIFSTHDMAIAEKMCDYIFMIYKGKKVLDGTLESILEAYGTDTVRVQLEKDAASWEGLAGVEAVRDFGRWQELRLSRQGDTQELLATLMERGRVRHFEVTRPTLHDIFVRTARPETEEAKGA